MSQSKSEALSFFDPNHRSLPDSLPVLFDVYATQQGLIFKESPKGSPTLVGDAKPITPSNVVGATVVDGQLVLVFNNREPIALGSLYRDSVYLDPPLPSPGIRLANGDFAPISSQIPGLSFVETPTAIQVQQTAPITPKAEGYAEASYRYLGANGTQAGQIDPPVSVWTKFNLTHSTDPDQIGLTLSNGEMTLPAGLYRIEMHSTSIRTSVSMLRLFCPAINAELMRTSQSYNGRQNDAGIHASGSIYGVGVFKLTAPRTIQFQYYLNPRGGAGAVSFAWTQQVTAHGAYSEPLKVSIWKCYDSGQGTFPTF